MKERVIATYRKNELEPYRVRYYSPESNKWFQSARFKTLAEAERFVFEILTGEVNWATIVEVQP